jgi:hypothetical protein
VHHVGFTILTITVIGMVLNLRCFLQCVIIASCERRHDGNEVRNVRGEHCHSLGSAALLPLPGSHVWQRCILPRTLIAVAAAVIVSLTQ